MDNANMRLDMPPEGAFQPAYASSPTSDVVVVVDDFGTFSECGVCDLTRDVYRYATVVAILGDEHDKRALVDKVVSEPAMHSCGGTEY
jgi:hypothetical protein